MADKVPEPRKTARQMLAIIILATDLPVPAGVRHWFHDGIATAFLGIDLDTIADAAAWAAFLGISIKPYVHGEGAQRKRYLGADQGVWHGWTVVLTAAEPVIEAEIAEQRDALTEIAERGVQ